MGLVGGEGPADEGDSVALEEAVRDVGGEVGLGGELGVGRAVDASEGDSAVVGVEKGGAFDAQAEGSHA